MIGRVAGALVAVLGGFVSAAPVPPGGKQTYTLSLPGSSAAAGFVRPGNKVNVIATVRNGDKSEAFPLVVNVLVVAVEVTEKGGFAQSVTISFSITDKQAKALEVAKRRGCNLELLLRHPDREDDAHDLDAVIRKLNAPEVAPAPRLVERK